MPEPAPQAQSQAPPPDRLVSPLLPKPTAPLIENGDIPDAPQKETHNLEPWRSNHIQKVTTRLLQSEEAEAREKNAQAKGEAWANDLPFGEQPLALIVQNPWAFASTSSEFWVPSSFKQAMQRPNLWWEPMQAKYDLLMEKGVWELVELPPGANLMGGWWMYAIKWGSKGEVMQRKGRWVA